MPPEPVVAEPVATAVTDVHEPLTMVSRTVAPATGVPSLTETVSGVWYHGPCWTLVPGATETENGVETILTLADAWTAPVTAVTTAVPAVFPAVYVVLVPVDGETLPSDVVDQEGSMFVTWFLYLS